MPLVALLRASDLTTLEPESFGHFIEVSLASLLEEITLRVQRKWVEKIGFPSMEGGIGL